MLFLEYRWDGSTEKCPPPNCTVLAFDEKKRKKVFFLWSAFEFEFMHIDLRETLENQKNKKRKLKKAKQKVY